MRAMSISRFGRASRIAISGTSVCPPAMMRTSSPADSSAQASSRCAGLSYSNDAGFIGRALVLVAERRVIRRDAGSMR